MSKYRSSDLTRQFYKLEGRSWLWFCLQTLFICWVTVFNYSQLWVMLCQPCELYEHSKLNYYETFTLDVFSLLPPPQFPSLKSWEERSTGLEETKLGSLSHPSILLTSHANSSPNHPGVVQIARIKPTSVAILGAAKTGQYCSLWEKTPRSPVLPRVPGAVFLRGEPPTLSGTCPAGHGHWTTTQPQNRPGACVWSRVSPPALNTLCSFAQGVPSWEFPEEPAGARRAPSPVISSWRMMLCPMLLAKPFSFTVVISNYSFLQDCCLRVTTSQLLCEQLSQEVINYCGATTAF